MRALFAIAMFASAALLFVVQPLAGKVLLPAVGGTPAVWNICLVFFQVLLLFGYLYADRLTRLGSRYQVILHSLVAAVIIVITLTVHVDPNAIATGEDRAELGLMLFLTLFVGAPFFLLATTSPLLQHWFAKTGSKHIYVLYAASNAGSLLGLLGYPFLIEPAFGLSDQEANWRLAFLFVCVAILACGGLSLGKSSNETNAEQHPYERIATWRILRWMALAAIPSSLLLSTTTHLTTDVAAVPLLWVLPLALYLVSMIVVFTRWGNRARIVTARVTIMLLVFLSMVLLLGATEPPALTAGILLLTFFSVALLCHGELVHDRPGTARLTTFYLAMSAGGALGGMFNALLAPVLFAHLGQVEFPLVLVFAALVRPVQNLGLERLRMSRKDAIFTLGCMILALGSVLIVPKLLSARDVDDERLIRGGLIYGVPAIVVYMLSARPLRFALGLAALFLASAFDPGQFGRTLFIARNFFGTLRVVESSDGKLIRLVHGTTLHGEQSTSRTHPPEPLTYYHRQGPVGRLLTKMPADRRRRIGVVGLGCGALAAYGRQDETWTFFEINPAVVRIAQDQGYFTYLATCPSNLRLVLGDARRRLRNEPDGSFDVLILDAFTSDAIPVHLLTKEAFAEYRRKLSPGGLLVFHLSNRYLDLPPLVARLAEEQDPPLTAKVCHDEAGDRTAGRSPSTWVVVGNDQASLTSAGIDLLWSAIKPTTSRVWTDDYSNLLGVWKRDVE